ncbi:MAG: MarR family winged helix-turn-helix transcriptional regulator [Burkholderiaceae bacterium]
MSEIIPEVMSDSSNDDAVAARSDLETSYCIALRRIARQMTARYDRWLAPSGLRATMFHLLSQLEPGSQPTITGLAERVGLDRSTLGRNLRVLERAGFVRLADAADERARAVSLTAAGHVALEAARPLWDAAQREVGDLLGADGSSLLAILSRLGDQLATD